jgi:hypothetical protein
MPTPTYNDAEAILSSALSSCVSVLEAELGSPLNIVFHSKRTDDYLLHVSAWSDIWNLDFGIWEVAPLRAGAKPYDHAANRMQNILSASGVSCTLGSIAPLG